MTIKGAVFIRHGAKPKPKPKPAYIVVFQVRPKGTHWSTAEHFITPIIAESQAELSALFEIAGGFDILYRHRPECRGRDWKVTASYENARVYLKSRKRRLTNAA